MVKRTRTFLSAAGWVAFAVLAITSLAMQGLRLSARAESPNANSRQSIAALTSLEDAFSSIAQKTRPAVVSVVVEKRVTSPTSRETMPWDDPFFRQFFGTPGPFFPHQGAPESMKERGAGSGVVVDTRGYILTNNHVVADADKIAVVLSDARHTRLNASIAGADPRTDMAVLKVNSPGPLVAGQLGDSDKVRVGQWAIAIGNQLGEFDATLTVGVISATGRRLNDLGEEADYRDLIQTDAAINPGNSGGPLVNVRGEIIGINTAIASPNGGSVGIGFAIPINMAKHVMNQLISHGRVERGYLGVSISDFNGPQGKSLRDFYHVEGGALVQKVEKGGPADRAGMQPEDVIVSLNESKVEDAEGLRTLVGSLAPHTTVRLGVVRDGKQLSLTAQLGSLSSPSAHPKAQSSPLPEQEEHQRFGVAVAPLTDDIRERLGVPDSVQGAVIAAVAEDSPADRAGLQQGDVIERVNHTRIDSLNDLRNALGNLDKRESVVLKVWSRGEEHIIAVDLQP
ncbi:MAG: PDZ domain-containing protein [Armatimonadetes bacterium]|nr:PDZ domain-containing protein [Armatimonadota bacterium]